ncbi:MAG: hypothetical protein KC912_14885 [Proteobacteria bacterium]|nr:hypothetical protein [Pseudomonadota bacterium]
MSRLWGRITDALIGVNALAALVFLVGGVVWALTGSQALQMLGTPVALLAFALSNLVFLVSAISPRVPLRVTLPLFVWQWYLVLGAMPFGVLALVNHWHILWPVLGSFVVVAVTLALVRTLPRNGALSVQPAFWQERRAVAPLRAVAVLSATAVLMPLLVAAYSVGSAVWSIEYATGGYAGLTTEGFVIRGRSFERGGTHLRLQGMMHIGEEHAYDALYASFGAHPNTVVLTEGVGDETGALGDGIGYSQVASRLGVVQQHAIPEDGYTVRNADVDVSQFSDETLEMLRGTFGIWQADDPLTAWLTFSMEVSGQDQDALLRAVYEDLVVARNDEVLRHVAVAEPEFNHIFVPWGAAHLPGIEAQLLEDGWQPGAESELVLVRWTTVAGALR